MKNLFRMVRRVPRAAQIAFLAMLVAAPIAYGATGGLVSTTDANGNGAWQTGPTASAYQLIDSVYATYSGVTNSQMAGAGQNYASGTVFVVPNDGHTWQLSNFSVRFSNPSVSGTVNVETAGAATAVGSGTAQLTGTASLSGTANTTVNGTLIASPNAVGAGSSFNVLMAGTLTNLSGFSATAVIKRLA